MNSKGQRVAGHTRCALYGSCVNEEEDIYIYMKDISTARKRSTVLWPKEKKKL